MMMIDTGGGMTVKTKREALSAAKEWFGTKEFFDFGTLAYVFQYPRGHWGFCSSGSPTAWALENHGAISIDDYGVTCRPLQYERIAK